MARLRFTVAAVISLLVLTLVTAAPDRSDAVGAATPPTYTAVVTDPNETDGPLDIALVRHRIGVIDSQHARISYTVTTYTRYAGRRLDPRQRNFVLELNRDGQPGSERNVRIAYSSGRVVAEVISNATRRILGSVRARRLNPRTVRVSGFRHLIGARSYFWTSTFHARWSSRCGFANGVAVTCQDSVPDDGWIRLDRPAWPASP